MTDKDTGGYAFPLGSDYGNENGMTLRDYFAGQALAGICADETATDNMPHEAIAKWAYKQADAMLAVRGQ